jgi:hypothetical protein
MAETVERNQERGELRRCDDQAESVGANLENSQTLETIA